MHFRFVSFWAQRSAAAVVRNAVVYHGLRAHNNQTHRCRPGHPRCVFLQHSASFYPVVCRSMLVATNHDSSVPVAHLDLQSGTLRGRNLLVLVHRVLVRTPPFAIKADANHAGKCQVVAECVRPDGSRFRVAEAVVGDATGCITLSVTNGYHWCWNSRI